MKKSEFIKIIDKYYFNYDLRELRICIWTGYNINNNIGSWMSVDAYNEDGDFISELNDYLVDLYYNIPEVDNEDTATLEDRKKLMNQQQKLTIKIRKWVENYDIVVKKTHANV